MATPSPVRMSKGLRLAIFVTFGALWASGSYWLILHYFFARPGDFGPVGHPWEPAVMRLHGWIAMAVVFLLGWVTALHVGERWPGMNRRVSGLSMVSVAVLLALSGYALYYTTAGFHDAAAVVHEVLGAAAILFALIHWRGYRTRSVRSRLA